MPAFRATGAPVNASASATSTAAAAIGHEGARPVVRVANLTSAVAHIAFGASGLAAATSADLAIPAGGVEPFTLTADQTHFRTILASGTGTVQVTPGEQGTI